MITIITCNYNSKEFADLLIRSIKAFTTEIYPIFIMDNSVKQELFTNKDYTVIKPDSNMGHGPGIDYLIKNHVKTKYTMVMDIDTHILRSNWDFDLITIMKNNPDVGLIAPTRCAAKPIHPGAMFFETAMFKDNNIPIQPVPIDPPNYARADFDVGQYAPLILAVYYNKQTKLMKSGRSIYNNVRGNTWVLNGKNTFFHFGFGTRLYGKTNIGTITANDIVIMRNNLMNQITF